MALAIRYAVNHGADVMLLPEQNSIYPKRAETMGDRGVERGRKRKKGVVIVPVWDLSMDMDKEEFFPIVR